MSIRYPMGFVLGLSFLLVGFFLIVNSAGGITGFAILEGSSKEFSAIVGAMFIFAGAVITRESTKKRILPKKHEDLEQLSKKDRTFRRKLVNLLDGQKDVLPRKIAYLLPRYDKVKDTGEYVSGHNYKVYQGRIDNTEEYFTVDHREMATIELGGEEIDIPTHIDIQERKGKNHYKKIGKVEIDWDLMIKSSKAEDILRYFRKKN